MAFSASSTMYYTINFESVVILLYFFVRSRMGGKWVLDSVPDVIGKSRKISVELQTTKVISEAIQVTIKLIPFEQNCWVRREEKDPKTEQICLTLSEDNQKQEFFFGPKSQKNHTQQMLIIVSNSTTTVTKKLTISTTSDHNRESRRRLQNKPATVFIPPLPAYISKHLHQNPTKDGRPIFIKFQSPSNVESVIEPSPYDMPEYIDWQDLPMDMLPFIPADLPLLTEEENALISSLYGTLPQGPGSTTLFAPEMKEASVLEDVQAPLSLDEQETTANLPRSVIQGPESTTLSAQEMKEASVLEDLFNIFRDNFDDLPLEPETSLDLARHGASF